MASAGQGRSLVKHTVVTDPPIAVSEEWAKDPVTLCINFTTTGTMVSLLLISNSYPDLLTLQERTSGKIRCYDVICVKNVVHCMAAHVQHLY